MVDCQELLPGGKFEDKKLGNKVKLIENLKLDRKSPSTFMCPYGIESLKIGGHYGSDLFQYVRLAITGCD